MTGGDWISVKEAAAMLGYSRDYFRRQFCNPDQPLLPVRVRKGKRRGILILKRAVLDLIDGETIKK